MPFECEFCGREFRDNYNLTRHQNSKKCQREQESLVRKYKKLVKKYNRLLKKYREVTSTEKTSQEKTSLPHQKKPKPTKKPKKSKETKPTKKSEKTEEPNEAIYIITSPDLRIRNEFKIGRHTGQEKKLLRRYRTYIPDVEIMFFKKVTEARVLERQLLQVLDKFRKKVNNKKSEWLHLDKDELHSIVHGFLSEIDKPS